MTSVPKPKVDRDLTVIKANKSERERETLHANLDSFCIFLHTELSFSTHSLALLLPHETWVS